MLQENIPMETIARITRFAIGQLQGLQGKGYAIALLQWLKGWSDWGAFGACDRASSAISRDNNS
jgi:hypothetical protein